MTHNIPFKREVKGVLPREASAASGGFVQRDFWPVSSNPSFVRVARHPPEGGKPVNSGRLIEGDGPPLKARQ